jgi:hypothetical protein
VIATTHQNQQQGHHPENLLQCQNRYHKGKPELEKKKNKEDEKKEAAIAQEQG